MYHSSQLLRRVSKWRFHSRVAQYLLYAKLLWLPLARNKRETLRFDNHTPLSDVFFYFRSVGSFLFLKFLSQHSLTFVGSIIVSIPLHVAERRAEKREVRVLRFDPGLQVRHCVEEDGVDRGAHLARAGVRRYLTNPCAKAGEGDGSH